MPHAGKPRGKLGLPGVVIPTGLARVRRALPEEAAAGTVVVVRELALVRAQVAVAAVAGSGTPDLILTPGYLVTERFSVLSVGDFSLRAR